MIGSISSNTDTGNVGSIPTTATISVVNSTHYKQAVTPMSVGASEV